MRQSDVTNWLFDECRQILADANNTGVTAVSDAQDNVDVADPSIDHPYPFIGVQAISSNPQTKGIGNGQLAATNESYTDGVVDEIDHERDTRLRVSLIPVTDNDAKLRDDLTDAIVDHFTLLASKDGYPDDITPKLIGESSPQGRPDDLVRATGVPFVLEYTTNITDSDPDAAESVSLTVETADADDTDNTATDAELDRKFGNS